MPASEWTRVGRTELLAMAEQFEVALKQALEDLVNLRRECDAYHDNLTNVQARCTELLLENRRLRAVLVTSDAARSEDE